MTMIRHIATLLLLLTGAGNATGYAPFVATYEVWINGKPQGRSVMSLSREDDGRWQYEIRMEGTRGMARMVGALVDQTTLFELHEGRPRPLAASSYSKVLFKTTERSGQYDWRLGEARWSGDLKPERLGPVALRPGDLNSALLNFALVRDVEARPEIGRVLEYRMVDEGRVREYRYRIEGPESVEVGADPVETIRVSREADGRRVVVWVAPGLPVPARMLQEDKDDPGIDMRLLGIER